MPLLFFFVVVVTPFVLRIHCLRKVEAAMKVENWVLFGSAKCILLHHARHFAVEDGYAIIASSTYFREKAMKTVSCG
jgi:hypothetical protein